jgi:hypothetical protein
MSRAEYGHICSWGFFWGYWNQNHSKIVIHKPSKDICGLCYQFHLGDRTTTASTPNNLEDDESSLQSDDKNKEEDGALMEALEREMQKIGNEIKQHIEDATSMRALC